MVDNKLNKNKRSFDLNKAIEIKNVSKSFGKKVILSKIDLSIEFGKIVGIQGENGSGKTVLYKLISGICRPNTGEIIVNKKNIGKEIDFPENIGLAMKDMTFEPNLTGYEILRDLSNIKNIIDKKTIQSNMNLVNLKYNDKTLYKNFSFGMKQKLIFIQAIMENQNIILLDEVFNGIDDETYSRFINIIKNLKNENKTIIITSHSRQSVYNICDKIYKIDNGKLLSINNNL